MSKRIGNRPAAVVAITAAGAALAAMLAPASTSAADAAERGDVRQRAYERVSEGVEAGERFRIYDPSVGEAEQWYINDHTFVRGPDGTWHMFGITHEEPANPLDEKFFAHATADRLDQREWVKQDPVIHADEASGETHVWAPYVMRHEGTYYMFYTGGTDDHENYRIQLATSKNLYDWKRQPDKPLFTDGFDARDPMVRRVGDRWVMYYTANSKPSGGNHIVAYRTSRDLRNWSDRKVAFQHPRTGTFGGPTESPYVHRDGDDYYLSVCCTSGYTDTRVYHSKDPLNFDISDEVGRIDEHASEVIADGDRLFISGAGWGQGGLYLRPLDLHAKRVTTGRIVRTPHYRLDLQTAPHSGIRSMDVRKGTGWRRVLDADERGTAPYLGTGQFGVTDPAGEARVVRDGDRLSLRDVAMGDEPVTVDWELAFGTKHFDSSVQWNVTDELSAPVWEAAFGIDTALPRVGDDTNPNRESGDVEGFSKYTVASSDKASFAAAYREDSAWASDNTFVDRENGLFVWQPHWQGGGRDLAKGTYDGGTWRIGASRKADDITWAERLYSGVNAGRP